MKKQFLEQFKTKGEEVNDLFAVKTKGSVKPYKFGFMFTLVVSDKTDEMALSYFGGDKKDEVESLHRTFEVQDVIHVKGKTDDFTGPITIAVNTDGEIKKVDEFDISDFVPKTKKDISTMINELKDVISKIQDNDIKRLLDTIFTKEFMEKYSLAAAAKTIHHSFAGGLLEHVLSMVKISLRMVELYPELNKDLLIAGCILHDIGKVNEIKVKTAIDYTTEGHLVGHISMGQKMVNDVIEKLDNFPDILKHKIIHLILSHHGEKKLGSPVEPLLPEAHALHHIDMLDSQVQKVLQQKEKAYAGEKWVMYKDWPTLYLE